VQKLLPTLGQPKEKFVFVSGIGCSSRFPYYMNTYGFHTVHGRAPGVAAGIKLTNPELSVWIITGDGDALSIGGNHLLHVLRRNLDVNILLFNNRIYGLTKGQYSPTSEVGKITKSTPVGSVDTPINPLLFALGAEAGLVARTLDVDAKHMAETMRQAYEYKGSSIVEIYQNCVIFNNDAFGYVSDRSVRSENQLQLEDGELLIFGKNRDKGIAFDGWTPRVVEFEAGNDQAAKDAGVVHYDAGNYTQASIIARIDHPEFPVPMGVVYKKDRPPFDLTTNEQIKQAREKKPLKANANDNLRDVFFSGNTWKVEQ
jgi:2-oxoglutarate ferredoxin oxidoreductase subunit beta